MDEILSSVFSWLSAFLVLVLLSQYPARKFLEARIGKTSGTAKTAYAILRKTHRAIGILVIPVVFCHCRITASVSGKQSFLGGILLIMLILLALTYCLKKPLDRHWKRAHQILSAALFILTVSHSVIEVL